MPKATHNSYHHGNLREALLDAAHQALERDSLEKLSLRGLAKAVGVTPSAVYSHFVDKTALLVELKTAGLLRLTDFMLSEIAQLPPRTGTRAPSPEARVRCLGQAYIHFALHNRNLFDILFSWTPAFERFTPECIAAGAGCEELIRNAIQDFIVEQGYELDHYHSSLGALSAWSMAHGITMLLRSGCVESAVYCEKWPPSFSSTDPANVSRIIKELCDIQLQGLKAELIRLHQAAGSQA